MPRVGDSVLGVITDKTSTTYTVDINSAHSASLDVCAFDGATKRNKPNLSVGAIVYARVAVANKEMDPELSCMIAHGPKKDWMTGESIYGELKGGFLFKTSTGLNST